MKKVKYILISLIIPVIINASGGSLYTRIGVGDYYNTNSARRLAIGGLGAAVADVEHISLYNPASLYRLGITRVETGVNFNGFNIEGSTNSAFYSQAQFSGVTIGFPIDHDYGVSLAFGMLPVTNVNYEVRNPVTNSLGTYNEIYLGEGGITKFFAGSSYKLPFNFILGASVDYYIGKILYSSKIDFGESASGNNAEFIRENSYHGFGTTLGLISSDLSHSIGIDEIKDFRFGLVFNYVSNITTDSTLSTVSSVGTDVYEEGSFDTKLPFRLGAGLSFKLNENYLIIADYLYQPWSDFEASNSKSNSLKDLQRLSAGLEYKDAKSVFNGTFWEQIILRCGLSFEQTQYLINATEIDQFSVHAGVGMPVGVGNFLDISFEYGTRGETGINLFKENFYKAAVSINFGELWFQRFDR